MQAAVVRGCPSALVRERPAAMEEVGLTLAGFRPSAAAAAAAKSRWPPQPRRLGRDAPCGPPKAAGVAAAGAPALLASLCVCCRVVAGHRVRGDRRELHRCRIAGRLPASPASARCRPEGRDGVDFEVTPWGGSVEPRQVFAVSDSTGAGARRLAENAWAQFGSPQAARLTLLPEVCSVADVKRAVEDARSAEGGSGALIIFTLASSDLCTQLVAECAREAVPCIDALQPLLTLLEEALGQPRLGSGPGPAAGGAPAAAPAAPAAASPPPAAGPIFSVSDSSGTSAYELVRAALRQFPGAGVEGVTVCPRVRSLEEARFIAEEAGRVGGLVAFTFASTGMSRYMRQQCELAGVRYVDLYQPVLLAMEIYLDYPAIGVAGGYGEGLATSRKSWEEKPV
mmetsp:Transcript_5650/g.17810  ORF Transcript_5650/g.17810 Transcript_5650/m.17810 type:complete len:397 (+) Transcript_5650:47-1237(+)